MATRPLIKESLLLLKGCGIDPYNQNAFVKLRLAVSVFVMTIACLNIFLDLLFNWKGLNSMEGISIFTALFQISTKLFLLVINRQNLSEVINKMNQFWAINKYGEELEIEIKNIQMFAKKILNFLLVFLIIAAGIFYIAAIAVPVKKLPLPMYFPRKLISPDYELMFGFEILIGFVAVFCVLGMDFLFVSLIINIICEFKIIKAAIKKIPINFNIKGDTQESLMEVYKIIDHHNLILGCIKKIRKMYSFMMLNVFFINMVEMAAGMLSMIASGFPPSFTNFSHFGVVTIFYMLELYYYCSIGQYLMTESETVSSTVYEIDWWIKTQPKLRRALVLIIQRSNKVECLTAGGMFELDLPSFRKVTRSALSFFTLVNAVYKEA